MYDKGERVLRIEFIVNNVEGLRCGKAMEKLPAILQRSQHTGRRGVEADEARAGEVIPLRSSNEAGEQTWATGCGTGGAKAEDRGEHERATYAPDSAPGERVPEARSCTRSCL